MKLSRLEITGFRGARGTLDLELAPGFTVLSGRNGAGKSTVCDAIEYVLTGNIRRESDHSENRESYEDYIAWQGNGGQPPDGTHVQLYVRKKGGREIILRRGSEEGLSMSYGALGDGAPGHEFSKPNEEIIANLCNPDQAPEEPLSRLCDTSIIRDERITELSVEAGERDRYKFVRRALGTSVFAEAVEKAKKTRDRLREREDVLRGELEKYQGEVDRLKSEIDEVREKAEDIESVEEAMAFVRKQLANAGRLESDDIDRAEVVDRARRLVVELRNDADELARLLNEYNDLDGEIEEYRNGGEAAERMQKLEEKLEETQEEIEQEESKKEEAKKRLDAFREQNPDTTKLADLHQLGKEIGLQDGECPLCGESHTPQEFEDRLSRLRNRVNDIAGQFGRLKSQVSERNERISSLTDRKQNLVDERDILQEKQSDLIEEITTVRTRVLEILDQEKYIPEAGKKNTEDTPAEPSLEDIDSDAIEDEINERRQIRKVLDEKVSDVEASLAHERIENLESDLKEATTKKERLRKQLQKTTKRAEKADKVRKRVEKKEGQVHTDRIEKLSPLLAELYSRMRPHIDWRDIETKVRGSIRRYLRFDTEGKNPSLFFSSGQRRAVGLAFLLSIHLSCSWTRLNTLILDDPVQHIDDFRALQLTEVLSAIRKSGRQLIVTVEDEDLARLLRRRLRSSDDQPGQHVKLAYDSRTGVHKEKEIPIAAMPEKVLKPVY